MAHAAYSNVAIMRISEGEAHSTGINSVSQCRTHARFLGD
jgi:hypothetical protein